MNWSGFSAFKKLPRTIAAFLGFLSIASAGAQPANDLQSNAEEIIIPDNGLGVGLFSSSKVNLKLATKDAGEWLPANFKLSKVDHKTVWFKFRIRNFRNITVLLRQKDTLIPQNHAGIVLYDSAGAVISESSFSGFFPAINKFGLSGNSCTPSGTYYIQVAANQKVDEDVWIDLSCSFPGSRYDEPDFSFTHQMTENEQKILFDVNACNSINVNEYNLADQPDKFNRSVWIYFKKPAQTLRYLFVLELGNKIADTSKYRLYLFDGRVAQLNSNMIKQPAAFNFVPAGSYLQNAPGAKLAFSRVNCADTSEFITLYISLRGDTAVSIPEIKFSTIADKGFAVANNPDNLPSYARLGQLGSSVVPFKSQITCKSEIKKPLCNPAVNGIIDSITVFPGHQFFGQPQRLDTFDLNAICEFEIPNPGKVLIEMQNAFNFWGENYRIRVYKGSITNTCDQNLIFKASTRVYDTATFMLEMMCLDAGKYYVQFLYRKEHDLEQRGNLLLSSIGVSVDARFTYTPALDPHSIIQNSPSMPFGLGDITSVDNFGFPAPGQDFPLVVVPYIIDGIPISYSSLFYTFSVSKTKSLDFNFGSFNNKTLAVFRGDCRNGLNTLKRLPPQYGRLDSFSQGNRWVMGNACNGLDSGTYTLVVMVKKKLTECTYDVQNEKLLVSDPFYAAFNYADAANAYLVNNGQPLDPAVNGKTSFSREYPIPHSPTSCDIDKSYEYIKDESCLNLGDKSRFAIKFFVFTLSDYSDLRVRSPNDKHILYRGDIRTDPNLPKNSQRLNECNREAQYCGLQQGIYTLVLFVNKSADYLPSGQRYFVLLVDKMLPSANDHASDAYDMGDISASVNSVFSTYIPINCNTGARSSDPAVVQFKSMNNVDYSSGSDEVQNQDGGEVRRNVWFTFTTTEAGRIIAKLSRKDGFDAVYQGLHIFRSDVDGSLDFSTVQNLSMVDSVEFNGLERIALTRPLGNDSISWFEKKDCKPERFYILVEKNYRNYYNSEIFLNLLFESAAAKSAPVCAAAIQRTLSADSTTASAGFLCVAVENNGANDTTDCFKDFKRVKRAWFRIDVPGNDPHDVRFKLKSNNFFESSMIRYRVHFGTCGNFNAGPCSYSSNGFYTLSCMGGGTYIVEVLADSSVMDSVQLTVIKAVPASNHCKPVIYLPPKVSLTYRTCGGDSIEFVNTSDTGADISYQWNFADGDISSLSNPKHFYASTKAIDTFPVKLRATNDDLGLSDSAVVSVVVFKDKFSIKIATSDTLCLDKRVGYTLTPVTTLPYSHSYEWSPIAFFPTPADSTQHVEIAADLVLKIKVTSAYCELADSLEFTYSRDSFLLGDTLLCPAELLRVTLPSGAHQIRWSDGADMAVRDFPDTGRYSVSFRDVYNCPVDRNFELKHLTLASLNIGRKGVVCNAGSYLFTLPKFPHLNYQWFDGTTSNTYLATKEGFFPFTISNNRCGLTDSVVLDLITSADIVPFSQKSKCPEDSVKVWFKDADSVRWYDAATDSIRFIRNGGSYAYTCYKSGCVFPGAVLIQDFPVRENFIVNTLFCEEDSTKIDAGEGTQYLWSPSGDTGRHILVKEEGLVKVSLRNGTGCLETDSALLTRRCDPLIYVPNVFTPNGDGKNDLFDVLPLFVTDYELNVYNRWGQLVFTSESPDKKWDGTFGGAMCPQDIYTWTLKLRGGKQFNREKNYSGVVSLLR